MQHFNTIAKSQSDTFAFWLEYMDMVFLLLEFIAAERDSDWEKHLELFQQMLIYDRAYDHYRYFSWGLVYLCDMIELPKTHPFIYECFKNGMHTVSRNSKPSSFNCVSTDMALEQSLNKDTKTKGKYPFYCSQNLKCFLLKKAIIKLIGKFEKKIEMYSIEEGNHDLGNHIFFSFRWNNWRDRQY